MVKRYSDDWVFHMEGDRIVGISVGAHDLYNMVGISYGKQADTRIICDAMKEAYRCEVHEKLFWDEIVDGMMGKICATVKPVTGSQVMEADTHRELEEIKSFLVITKS